MVGGGILLLRLSVGGDRDSLDTQTGQVKSVLSNVFEVVDFLELWGPSDQRDQRVCLFER